MFLLSLVYFIGLYVDYDLIYVIKVVSSLSI